MTNNPYEPYDNINTDNSDFNPSNYYQEKQEQIPNPAEQYAKYGEDFYNGKNYDEPAVEQTPNPNPYTCDYSSNPYTSNPYTSNPYTSQAYTPKPPKVKKEKKPISRGVLAVALIISILCSGILGTAGGYLVSSRLNYTSGGLTIKKSEAGSSSLTAQGAPLSTSKIVEIAADTVVEITTEMVVTGSFSQQYIQEGAGSGVIISADGYIVTNYHVIEGASEITVTLRNQKDTANARIIGVYEAGDLALIKIDTDKELKSATFGNSDALEVGDYAVAIGNPLGQLGGTVTDGIISALDREVIIDDETMNLLQTNAEISPGNSGGGLFNGNGELIGIVNAKSSTQSAEGLGFAIPINDVQDVLSDLKEYGYVKGQIDLGMSLLDISSTAEAWMYGVSKSGVYVSGVDNGSNAAKAGFYGGDIILQVNSTDVSTTADVKAIIDKLKVGDVVTFKVYRNGETGTLKMELEEYTRNGATTQKQEQNSNNSSIWDIFGY